MRYIALLRAVNVGGRNTIKMADLRSLLGSRGLQQVRTYIQSGNILFDSDAAEDSLRQEIEHHTAQRFGFHIDVVLRTLTEFELLFANCPYLGPSGPAASSSAAPSGLFVAFLETVPPRDAVAALSRYVTSGEQYQTVGRDVYLPLPQGTARSKLVAQVQKLGLIATVRNWKTVEKLYTLAHDHPNDHAG